jgi:hypothetical protein
MDEKTRKALNKEMEIHTKPGPKGMKYSFVTGKDVISRLNEAFEHDWSSEVIEEKVTPEHIVMRVRIKYGQTYHEGYGGAPVALYAQGPNVGKPVDLSNSYKAAYTSALKKAAEQFGIGLGFEEEETIPSLVVSPVQHRLEINPEVSPEDAAKAMFAKLDVNALGRAVQEEVERMRTTGTAPPSVQGAAVVQHSAPITTLPAHNIISPPPARSSYDPQSSRKPEVTSTFVPSNNGMEKINDIQANAINGLLRVKKLSLEQIISKTLPGCTKSKIEELTQDDAKVVIRHLNTIKNG